MLPGTSYRITGWLGDGAMGVVYRAKHTELEREVGLKILRPEACGSARLAKMFREEAKTASRLDSDFIVEVYDLGELSDGRVWFTMPLLDGRSLRDAIEEAPIEPGRAIGILRQVCKALAEAHRAGIIHRDVKPENVMLIRHHGRDDAVRMLDWGVAAMRDDAEIGVGVVAGTPYYIAPEIISGLPYDHRADLYSLGCTAFEMLARHPPFKEDGVEAILLAHVEAKIPSVRELARSSIPAALDRVIRRCLAKHPADRFADAEELEAALCEAQIEAELHSTWDDLPLPDVDPERRAKLADGMPDPAFWGHRRRWLLPAFVGAGLTLAAVAGIGLLQHQPDSEALQQIDALTDSARAAAAQAHFLYPPVNDPSAATAYEVILELEDLDGPGRATARERATELRQQFANTLLELGNRYWERQGGRPFAIDYYAEALVFEPDLETARTRASLTPGELADLRDKARSQEFSPEELTAVQPLVALAKDDPEERAAELAALQDSEAVGLSTAMRLERLQERPKQRRRRRPSRSDGDAPSASDVPSAAGTGGPDAASEVTGGGTDTGPAHTADGDDEPAVEENLPRAARRDTVAARSLTEEGNVALRAGRLSQAEKRYKDALRADDGFAAAYDGLSRIAFHRGNYMVAARHGEKAVRYAPRRGKYRIDLGDAYYKAYRYGDAAEQYGRAQALGHPGAASRLAKARAKADR